MFEYASLGLYVLGICVFITNIKTGIECTLTGQWGEVTENQGLAVIASSTIILEVVFLGVLFLQAGLWYSNYDYQKRLKKFYEEEAIAEANAKAAVLEPKTTSKAKKVRKDAKKENKKQK